MSDEIDALLRKARRTVQAGYRLLSGGFAEEATSESYYAKFYAAKAMLLSEGERLRQHKHVIRAFEELLVETRRVDRRFLASLDASLRLRHSADYETDLTFAISEEQARESLRSAEEFLNMAEAFLKEGLTGNL